VRRNINGLSHFQARSLIAYNAVGSIWLLLPPGTADSKVKKPNFFKILPYLDRAVYSWCQHRLRDRMRRTAKRERHPETTAIGKDPSSDGFSGAASWFPHQ
jgi:hypothetical protein